MPLKRTRAGLFIGPVKTHPGLKQPDAVLHLTVCPEKGRSLAR